MLFNLGWSGRSPFFQQVMSRALPSWRTLPCRAASICTISFSLLVSQPQSASSQEKVAIPSGMQKITTVEGITEYRLENGLQVLLFPDNSKPVVTVNLTIFVGSRHEGYGEAGMAHLLEHMLFKGTPNHKAIPKLLQDRGADFNGTTWLDRTNYYETLPSEKDNLEFAIRLEADRMVNSYIDGKDLLSEMTVVRNEFEQGENSAESVLQERMFATSFLWHNYGKSTIGNRSDIERVPIGSLQAFYRRHYRPDNAMLVIAGKFDSSDALKQVSTYFGVLDNPKTPLNQTYTQEPPQDGERTTVIRRVGENQHVGASYHIPAGGDPEYAAVEVLTNLLSTEPSGRLYQSLVVTKKATSVYGGSFALHDPGMMYYGAVVPKDKSLEEARLALVETLEGFEDSPVTKDEVDRSIIELLKQRELQSTNSTLIATDLSEWGAQGDWRLYFLFRDRLEKVTVKEVQAAATKYLARNNRSVALFIPAEMSEKVTVPPRADVKEMLADYKGRSNMTEGEVFDTDPLAIEKRLLKGELATGIRYSLLPKKTRGETVSLMLTLRFGDEKSMFGKSSAIDLMGSLMMRGTEQMDYQKLKDTLDRMRANLLISSQQGLLQLRISTKREYLPELMPVLQQLLRRPRFAESELDVIKNEQLTMLQGQISEPEAQAPLTVSRTLNTYPRGDVRYVGSIEEEIEDLKKVGVVDIRQIYDQMLGGTQGELVAVGDFDAGMIKKEFEKILDGWKATLPYQRASNKANIKAAASEVKIETPDKANSVYYASQQYELKDSDPRYAALVIGNYVFGGGSLSSRLGDRVRQTEGLSYGIGSGVNAHPIDARATMTIFAITNPVNRDKLVGIIREELLKLLKDGITEEELAAAKQGYLQSLKVDRSTDAQLTGLLAGNIFAKRDMAFQKDFEAKINALTVANVNGVLRELVDPERLVIATAGDFANAKK